MFLEPSQEEVDHILEKETQQNKNESWNKLNKTVKLQKLSVYAERYGVDHKYSIKEIKQLNLMSQVNRRFLFYQAAINSSNSTSTMKTSDILNLFLH